MLTNSKNKNFYKIYQKSNPDFNLKISKKSIDIIKKLYGSENIKFISFIKYSLHKRSSVVIHQDTLNKELDDTEANQISEKLNKLGNYLIIPESLKSLDEDKQYEQAIKTSGKFITHIMEKAGIDFDKMLYYVDLQVVTHEINERVIDYYTFEKIFHLIYFLLIKLKNKDNINLTFYSFRQILKNSGIKLEEILPYLHIDIKNINRKNNDSEETPLYKGVQKREVKELISSGMHNINFDINKGTDSLGRIDKNNFDDLDLFRNEESNFLKDLIEQINKKKDEIKNSCEDESNQIIELKNNKNEIFYVSKINYDKLIKSKEENNQLKIKDINDNFIDSINLDLKDNENINKTYIKIFNGKNKGEFIFILKEDLYNKLHDFKYIKQKDKFNGKDINGENKEMEGLFMDLQCGNLSIKYEKEEQNINRDNNNSNEKINSNDKFLDSSDNKKNTQLPTINNFIKYKDYNEIDPEYENIINPYNNLPFKEIKKNKKEESKNEDNNNIEQKIGNIPEEEYIGERKTYRIRRAILFKRPQTEKEKDKDKEDEKQSN